MVRNVCFEWFSGISFGRPPISHAWILCCGWCLWVCGWVCVISNVNDIHHRIFSTIRFHDDDDDDDSLVLSNSQVAVILQVSAGAATNRDEELNDIYRKTQQYVNRFNTMNNPEKEHQEVVDELDNLQE